MSWRTIIEKNDLAIDEIFLSKLGENLRLEAEFYVAGSSHDGIKGEDIIDFVQYGTSKGLNENNLGYPVLRLNEFELSFAGVPDKYCDLLSEAEYQSLKVKKDDVLICRTNGNPKYVGKAALAMEDAEYAFASYLFRIRPNNEIKPHVLVSYLNSKVGRKEIEKYAIVSNQANFSPAKFRQISIPVVPKTIQEKIQDIFTRAWELYRNSKEGFARAEALVLEETGLGSYRPSKLNVAIRTLGESIEHGRFDGEYWQTEFDDIQDLIKKNSNGFDTFEKLFKISDEKIKVVPGDEYRYVELADVNGATGTIDNLTNCKGKDLPSRGRMNLEKGDIIVSSVEGSLDKVALVSSEEDNIVGSTGFFVLRQEHYLPEVALTLLKISPISKLLKRQAQGTILTAIPKSSLSRVLLPKLDKKFQEKIRAQVVGSHEALYEAKQLLDKAKRAIEILVEQNEKEALKYLS